MSKVIQTINECKIQAQQYSKLCQKLCTRIVDKSQMT